MFFNLNSRRCVGIECMYIKLKHCTCVARKSCEKALDVKEHIVISSLYISVYTYISNKNLNSSTKLSYTANITTIL